MAEQNEKSEAVSDSWEDIVAEANARDTVDSDSDMDAEELQEEMPSTSSKTTAEKRQQNKSELLGFLFFYTLMVEETKSRTMVFSKTKLHRMAVRIWRTMSEHDRKLFVTSAKKKRLRRKKENVQKI